MTSTHVFASVAAAAVVAWPVVQKVISLVRIPDFKRAAVGYETAIHNLAVVRSRLSATGQLNEGEKKAIDTLTLALVAGSDK